MALSGISVANECDDFHKDQQTGGKYQWVIYKIGSKPGNDKKQQQEELEQKKKDEKLECVKVDKFRPREFSCKEANELKDDDKVRTAIKKLYDEFMDELPEDEARYAVFDMVGLGSSKGSYKDHLAFLAWNPDAQKIKSKMIYASTKDTLKKRLSMPTSHQLSCKSEQDVKDLFEELWKKHS